MARPRCVRGVHSASRGCCIWRPCPVLHTSNTASVRALAEASPQRSASAPGKPPGDKSSTSSSHVACAPVLLPLRAALLLDVGLTWKHECATCKANQCHHPRSKLMFGSEYKKSAHETYLDQTGARRLQVAHKLSARI